jgi:hypothetical protein
MRSRRTGRASGRPLKRGVRRALRGDKRREEFADPPSFGSAVNRRQRTRSSCRRLCLAQPACACGAGWLRLKAGRAPSALLRGGGGFEPRAASVAVWARLAWTMLPSLADAPPHAHSATCWVPSNPRLERAVRDVVGARFARQMYASRLTRAWRRAAAAQAPR